jgi:anti-anti-sigma factor
MQRNVTVATTSQRDTAEAFADRARADDGDIGLPEPVHARPRLTLANARAWRHTLILKGKLDQGSAPELEEEIECLCEEGVTTLTLDLRQLEEIDSTGVTVIAFRSAVCKRRGHDFAVIPGSRVIQRALAEAGATDLLTPEQDESVVRRFPSRSADGAFSDRATTMIKSL